MLFVVIVLSVDADRLGGVGVDAVAVQVSIKLLIAERAPPRLICILRIGLPGTSVAAHAAPLAPAPAAPAAFALAVHPFEWIALAGVRLDVGSVAD